MTSLEFSPCPETVWHRLGKHDFPVNVIVVGKLHVMHDGYKAFIYLLVYYLYSTSPHCDGTKIDRMGSISEIPPSTNESMHNG